MREAEETRINFYTPVSRGGAAWYVGALVDALAGAGARVNLIAPPLVTTRGEPSHPGIVRDTLPSGGGGSGNLLMRALRSASRVLGTFPRLWKARRFSREYVVTFYDWLPVQIAQFLWIKALGGTLTHIVHDATPHAMRFVRGLHWLERWLQRLSYALPDRVVTLTEHARADLIANWHGRADIHVIPHGAFVDEALPAQPGGKRILLFGSLRRNKRIFEAIEAMRLLQDEAPAMDLHLTIAGAPHVEDVPYWRDCEAGLGELEGLVTTEIGFIPDKRLQELLAQSDAVLLPYEDFNSASGVAIQSAFAERILIATAAGGIADLIAEGVEVVPIASPVTPAGIADAIRAFAAMPAADCRNAAARSRSRLAESLSWDRIGMAYVSMLRAA